MSRIAYESDQSLRSERLERGRDYFTSTPWGVHLPSGDGALRFFKEHSMNVQAQEPAYQAYVDVNGHLIAETSEPESLGKDAGEHDLSSGEVIPLAQFIEEFGEGLLNAVQNQNPPIYTGSANPARAEVMANLKRSPFPPPLHFPLQQR